MSDFAKDTNVLANDCISRQAVLAMLDDIEDEVMDGEGYQYGKWSDYVEQLPAAQPPLEEFEWCTDCKEYDQKNHCCHRFTKVIRQTVEELKSQTQWIPCSERLPDESDDYLCTYNTLLGQFVGLSIYEAEREEFGFYSTGDDDDWNPVTNVVAWMPLPDPYGGKQE